MSVIRYHYFWCFLVLGFTELTDGKLFEGLTQTWGYPVRYADPIYDIEIKHPAFNYKEENWLDIEYPDTTKLNQTNASTITSIHVFDLINPVGLDQAGKVLVLSGGVAYRYVKMRFIPCNGCPLHFMLTIHGLEL